MTAQVMNILHRFATQRHKNYEHVMSQLLVRFLLLRNPSDQSPNDCKYHRVGHHQESSQMKGGVKYTVIRVMQRFRNQNVRQGPT